MNDYKQKANEFLKNSGITFKAIFKGDKCPMWDDEKHIHGDRYLITFTRPQKGYISKKHMSLSFWNSKHDQDNGITPTAYVVLACITKYNPISFEDFCGEYGYDTDNRKALKTYKAVCNEWDKVINFFTESEIEQLQDIN